MDVALATYMYTNGVLASVTDDLGRSLTYTYDAEGYVSTITLPDNGVLAYTYQAAPVAGTLNKVTWPDGSYRTYFYNETGLLHASAPKNLRALTGQVDEKGVRVDTTYYEKLAALFLLSHLLG